MSRTMKHPDEKHSLVPGLSMPDRQAFPTIRKT